MTTHLSAELLWWEKGWEARKHEFPRDLAEDTANVPNRYRPEWERGWDDCDVSLVALSPNAPKFIDETGQGYLVFDPDGNILG